MKQIKKIRKNKAVKPKTAPQNSIQPFSSHLKELQARLLLVLSWFIVATAITYHFRQFIIRLITDPLGATNLIYLTPAGGFSFIFQVCVYVGLLLTIPFGLYQLYKFIAPAVPHSSRRKGMLIVTVSSLLMVTGGLFGYLFCIPAALHFFATFSGENSLSASITADSYLNFVAAYTLGLGILFQTPLVLIIINSIKKLPGKLLLQSQRFVIVGAFIIAAFITPTPDMVNQTFVALPVIFTYELGLLVVLYTNRQRH